MYTMLRWSSVSCCLFPSLVGGGGPKDNEAAIHHTAGGSTGGSRVFLLPWQCGGAECQGIERSDGQTQESWKSVPNVEEENY